MQKSERNESSRFEEFEINVSSTVTSDLDTFQRKDALPQNLCNGITINSSINLSNKFKVYAKLENNFNLSNKYGLFYSMQKYYKVCGRDPFEVLPVTFHIKRGLIDPEYYKFVSFFEQLEIQKT